MQLGDPTNASLATAVAPPAVPPSASVTPCISCGYDLRGLNPAGVCPECGRPVADTLDGNRLWRADPAWLKRVLNGLNLALLAMILSVLSWALSQALGIFQIGPSGITATNLSAYSLVDQGLQLAILALSSLGYYRLSCQEPQNTPHATPDGSRTWLRRFLYASIATTVAALLTRSVAIALLASPTLNRNWIYYLAAAGIAGYVAQLGLYIFTMLHIRTLSLRLPNYALASTAAIFAWVLPAMFFLSGVLGLFCVPFWFGMAVAAILYFVLLYLFRTHLQTALRQAEARIGAPAASPEPAAASATYPSNP